MPSLRLQTTYILHVTGNEMSFKWFCQFWRPFYRDWLLFFVCLTSVELFALFSVFALY